MFLLNLSLAEFLALFGVLSSMVVALYLLDRSRRRQVVPTLRFWKPAQQPQRTRRRRRIQQPLSLLLQLAGIALLLLAIAQLRFGSRESAARDHVLILDTSAWMQAAGARGTLMEEARAQARAWLRSLPPGDRVLLLRADALATPAGGFDADRKSLEEAVARSEPGATALDLNQALEFARRMLAGRAGGEIVLASAGRVRSSEGVDSPAPPSNLRVLPVADRIRNCGLRGVGLRHSPTEPDLWEIFVSVRNYSDAPRELTVALSFGGAAAGAKRVLVPPAAEQNVTFEYRTHAAGWLEARLLPGDAFSADDRAVLELPEHRTLLVAVYSDSPAWLRPMLAANPNLRASYWTAAQYDPARAADLVVLDRFTPRVRPKANSIWIEPRDGSPVSIRAVVADAILSRWRSDHPLATGLRVQDLRLSSTAVFQPAAGDIAVAEVAQGPVILARPGPPKMVFLGFHPSSAALRYELATPLVFANVIRWMAPEVFRRWELNAGSAGAVVAHLDADAAESEVSVLSEDNTPLPFSRQGNTLHFFAGAPGTVRVRAGDREIVYSLTLPEVAAATWEPPRDVRRGVPPVSAAGAASRELWQILAVLGALCLLADWIAFGRKRAQAHVRTHAPRGGLSAAAFWKLRLSSLRRRAS